jgi:hypothetical protein
MEYIDEDLKNHLMLREKQEMDALVTDSTGVFPENKDRY